MNFWMCECGKKVSENMKVCPYCKADRFKKAATVESDSNQMMKVIIGVLVGIITVGGYMYMKKDSVTAEQPKYAPQQVTVVNAKQSQPQPAKGKPVPQVAVDALDALKKLQARTQVGITYKDYGPALGDAKFALNLFVESAHAKEFPELSEVLRSAFLTYDMAHSVWRDKFQGTRVDNFGTKAEYPVIFMKFPEADRDYASGGVVFDPATSTFELDRMISFLFSKASEELQKASAMVAR